MDGGAEARDKQRTVTVAIGRPQNLQKSRVSQPVGEKRGKKSHMQASNGETKGLGMTIGEGRPG